MANSVLDGQKIQAKVGLTTEGDEQASKQYETTICQLAPKQSGVVTRLQGEASLRSHLLEMGFTRGTTIEFLRRAPLGDPIDVKLRGYRLSLREREACAVVVATEHPKPPTKRRSIFGRRAK